MGVKVARVGCSELQEAQLFSRSEFRVASSIPWQ